MSAKILVIEDNMASLELMSYLLGAFGHTPIKASTGEKGVELAQKEKPDLILCDVQLPKMDGYEVCRIIKADPNLINIPVVAVTAFAMVGDREKLLSAGFDGYISKPVNPETLMESLNPYIGTSTLTLAQTHTSSQTPDNETHENKARNDSKLRATILVVDNSPANIGVIRCTLEPHGYEVISAGNVRDALALARKNPPDMFLSDVHMPDENGFDLIRAVKNDPVLCSLPFVFITSSIFGEKTGKIGLELGAKHFIMRPINAQALLDEIEICLNEK